MISFTFLLCSSLLLSSAFAEGPAEVETPADKVPEPKSTEITKAAAVATIEVVNDLLDGKDLKKSMVERSITALEKITGPVASAGHSFMKRVKELLDGKSVSEVVGNTYKSIQKKFSGKNKTIDDITNEVGEENMLKFVQGITKVIEDHIRTALKKRQEKKEGKPE